MKAVTIFQGIEAPLARGSEGLRTESKTAAVLAGIVGLASTLVGAEPRYEIAAYYFPNYHPNPQNSARYGTNWTEWDLMRAARPRFPGHAQPKVPAWGYDDESQPEVMARKISTAAEHGVTAFIFDWYWYGTNCFLERGLEQGFLKATNSAQLKFVLMWANHEWVELFPARADGRRDVIYPATITRESFDRMCDYVVKNYFSQRNHWKLAGRPYFSIYELMTLVKELGGIENTREALERFRARTKAAGFPDLHLNAVAWGLKPPPNHPTVKSAADMVSALGVDSVTSYCWLHHVYPDKFPRTDYAELAVKSAAVWDNLRRDLPAPYFPNVSMGWDSTPRTEQNVEFKNGAYPYTPVIAGNTPDQFRQALERARTFLDGKRSAPRILTLNAWNEWTEGSYLEPDSVNGLKYLEAIRAVFPSRVEQR